MSTQAAKDEIRHIDVGAAPERFARGWHCLGPSDQYKDGEPHTVEAFGKKLVIWAGDDGINVLDAFCRHMGGDLSRGTIKDGNIACPFHDWRWGGNGRCQEVPYARRVPLRARTQAFPTLDQDGLLHVWHDPEGKPPPDDVTIPRIEGALSEGWTNWRWDTLMVEGANCREIVDNVVDMAHFFYVHFSFPTYFKNVFEGHVATQYMKGLAREDMRPSTAKGPKLLGNDSVASYYGPSFMIDELTYHYEGYDLKSVLINCHYPVTPTSFMLQYGLIAETTNLGDEAAQATADKMSDFIIMGFQQDIEIWKYKTRIDNPLLTEEDGPVYQLRRWYDQFYVDADKVTDEMTARFEFEMDTTRPVEKWRQEVEENLARREHAKA
jgi:3-ketosteroid 9alpha-monooxygenase subunit A